MNEYALLHIADSNYCFPMGVKSVMLRLRTQRGEDVDKISVIHSCKYIFQTARQETAMKKRYSDRLFDYYETLLELDDVRFAYVFKLTQGGVEYYYSEDGLTRTYDFSQGFYNFFQLPYINEVDVIQTVEWMRSAVFYQIFVDRFKRGDEEKDDSYINLKWGENPSPKSFAGGDLKGILQKLDHIKDLGANTIYLTPIFSSVSNHKYDITDYKVIDKQFGNSEDFHVLVKTAHEKGIRIVLDAVFNHCSSDLIQFQDVLSKGRASEYYDWFVIDGEKPDPEKGNYECFGSCAYMPKLNTSNPKVREFLLDIACCWIKEYDIDGWRLDVSDEISHDFWRLFRKEVKSAKSDCVIIGENWHDAYTFLMGDQYDSIMNYAFTKSCLDYFAFGASDAKGLADKLNQILMRNKMPVNEMMMNLLDSHDTHRFFSEVGKDKDKLLAAIAIETCFVGAPCIYYGTELCLEGGYDPDCRRTFDWDESNWDRDFLGVMKKILALKQENTLQYGDIKISAQGEIFAMQRSCGKDVLVLYHNHADKAYSCNKAADSAVSNLYGKGVLEAGGFAIMNETLEWRQL